MTVVLMALAGGLGAACRSLVDVEVGRRTSSRLPWATFAVNVTGSFALGLLVGAAAGSDVLLVVGTGFLGGYTTFSSASLEAARALVEHRRADAAAIAVAMAAACVAAASLGVVLTR